MLTVVVCPDCQYIWIVEDEPDTTTCGRCGTAHQFKNLRHLKETSDKESARRYRALFAADINDNRDAFEDAVENADIFSEPDSDFDREELIEEAGFDTESVKEAGDVSASGSRSEKEIVRDGIEELNEPSVEDVVTYAGDRGVGEEKTRKVIDKLREQGRIAGRNPIRFL